MSLSSREVLLQESMNCAELTHRLSLPKKSRDASLVLDPIPLQYTKLRDQVLSDTAIPVPAKDRDPEAVLAEIRA